MEKYEKFLRDKFDVITWVVAILCAVVMFFAITIEMDTPVDAKELEYHYNQLEMVKQDITSVSNLKDADITIDESGMTVTFNGKYHHLKACFDENKNYVNAKVIDNRVGSSIIVSLFLVIAAFGMGCFVGWTVLLLLYIPVAVHALVLYVKKKVKTKKQ